ncbi:MAG: flagellar export protein FliJ [Deltaproteobacteria bacterium]|jgi:flagellar FliJ protein|nr:flagellar export protein FliJ [Deltaproteobacteria bacterium]
MYRFNLESLLNYRRYQEELLQKELADSKNELVQQEQKLHHLKQAWRASSLDLHQRQKKGGPVSGLIVYFRYLDRLSMDIDNQKRQVVKCKKQFDRKRRELLEIIKKRKALEKLKEKGFLDYTQRMLKKERSFMDEAAATRYKGKR